MARYFSFRWLTAAVLAMAISSGGPARAQFVCGDRDYLVARLAETFLEKRIVYGVAGDTAIVEVFVSPSGTWTMLMTDVTGQSCIVAAGNGWENTLAVTASEHGN